MSKKKVDETLTPEPVHLDTRAVVGQVVTYVMPDGTDREAMILRLDGDVAVLNVQVALTSDDQIQRRQFPGVPRGKAGEPGTWREATE